MSFCVTVDHECSVIRMFRNEKESVTNVRVLPSRTTSPPLRARPSAPAPPTRPKPLRGAAGSGGPSAAEGSTRPLTCPCPCATRTRCHTRTRALPVPWHPPPVRCPRPLSYSHPCPARPQGTRRPCATRTRYSTRTRTCPVPVAPATRTAPAPVHCPATADQKKAGTKLVLSNRL